MTQPTVYLAGPMTHYPEWNFPAFHEAAAQLRGRGFQVYNPAEQDEREGFDPLTGDGYRSRRHYMRRDLPAVCDAAALVFMEGSEFSKGAKLEIQTALAVGIPTWTLAEALEYGPETLP